MIKSFLQKQEHTVILAKNGKDAIKKLEEIEYDVDIIISDVIMPEMTGIELHDEVKKIKPDLKFLFTTGYTENASKLNVENYIQKPYDKVFYL